MMSGSATQVRCSRVVPSSPQAAPMSLWAVARTRRGPARSRVPLVVIGAEALPGLGGDLHADAEGPAPFVEVGDGDAAGYGAIVIGGEQDRAGLGAGAGRSEEHTSELQSP